jgi:hypothetical protein
MTTDWEKHYREVFATEINKLKMKDTVGFGFTGPMYVPTPQGLTVGWSMMLTLKHNVLIGQPDVGVHIPVMGMTPEDDLIRKGAQFLLENAREERHKMSTVVNTDDTDTVLEGQVVPRQGNGSPVPAGLLPNGVGGSVQPRAIPPAGFKATAEGHKEELPVETESAEEKAPEEKPKKLFDDEPTVTDSDSGTFKIVDRRRRK